jgi:hypothetical protein
VLESQQQGRLVVLDLEEVLPAVLHDVRARGPLGKQGIARDQHAYDPLPGAIVLFVLTAVTHLLLQALGVDATLEVFSRLIRSIGA